MEDHVLTEDYQWFKETPEATMKKLDSSEEGLSNNEAARRLIEYGPNEIEEEDRVGRPKFAAALKMVAGYSGRKLE